MRRFDDPLSNHVAFHDPTENIDKDRLNAIVLKNDLEAFPDLIAGRAATHIKKIGWFAAGKFDRIHRGHREPSAIHEAPDVSLHRDIAQAKRFGLPLTGILFVRVFQRPEFLMTE